MMSFKSIGAGEGGGAADYFEGEAAASRDDYYAAEGDQGRWLGGGAQALGLAGNLQPGQLKAMLEGFDLATGEPLASNAGSDHKCGYDIVFSAPKSVSLAWALSDEQTRAAIAAAQSSAAEKAFEYLQKNAFTTRDRSGPEPVTSLLAAAYQHGASRDGDPQLHTHVPTANLAPDGRAIDFDSRHKMAAGAIYRSELAAEMQKMGFQIERDKSSFRLAGVDPKAEQHFSRRRQQILVELQKSGFTSAKAAGVAALLTRERKETIEKDQQLEAWRRAAAEIGLDAQALDALRNQPAVEIEPMPTHDEILAELTQQASTFTPHQLNTAVATAAQGKLDAAGIDAYIKNLQADKNLVYLQSDSPSHRSREGAETRFTSREMLEIERGIVTKAQARTGETAHVTDPSRAIEQAQADALARGRDNGQGGFGATAEQKKMLAHICHDAAGVAIVQGMAGTGKSYTLGIARQAWESQGHRVIGAALAGKAADGLKSGAGIESSTIHSLLLRLENGKEKLTKNDIIVIDEAGMVGSRLLSRILTKAHAAGAKVVLVGDSKQLQPIDAGGAFRALSEKIGAAKLTDITRQNSEIDRQVVRDFASGNAAAAIKSMDDRGLIKTNADRAAVIEHLVADWAQHRDPSKPGESLMLAGTRADVRELNNLARERMKSQHRLCNEHTIQTTGGDLKLAEGDRIIFKKNDKKLCVKNGQLASVERIDFDKKGELVVIAKLDGGQRVTVRPGTDADRGQYADLRHGYAVSVHAAQGVTVDKASVLVHDRMSDREWSYVAASRARESTKIFCTTEQKSELKMQMSSSHQADFSADYKEIEVPEVEAPEAPKAAEIEAPEDEAQESRQQEDEYEM